MALASMTGFARAQGESEASGETGADTRTVGGAAVRWAWEVRSVNGRGLDLRTRLPQGMDALDGPARARIQKILARGSVTASLTLGTMTGPGALKVNEAALADVIAMTERLQRDAGAAPPRADGILAVRGVVEAADPAGEPAAIVTRHGAAMLETLDRALAALDCMRREEGARIEAVLADALGEIEAIHGRIAARADIQAEAVMARFRQRLNEFRGQAPEIAEERIFQEAALLATKADIREELDRLGAHTASAWAMLAEDAPVGRRLDFLCQEFNREANTICSKSADLALTQSGLDLKAKIEQFREQVQNIE